MYAVHQYDILIVRERERLIEKEKEKGRARDRETRRETKTGRDTCGKGARATAYIRPPIGRTQERM